MATLVVVRVTAECEELITTLPRGCGWSLVSENYNEDGSGEIAIEFEGDELSAAAEQALNTNDEVVSYEVINLQLTTEEIDEELHQLSNADIHDDYPKTQQENNHL